MSVGRHDVPECAPGHRVEGGLIADLGQRFLEVGQVGSDGDVVLAGAKDAVVVPFDEQLSGTCRARLEVTGRNRHQVEFAVPSWKAGRLDVRERGPGMGGEVRLRARFHAPVRVEQA